MYAILRYADLFVCMLACACVRASLSVFVCVGVWVCMHSYTICLHTYIHTYMLCRANSYVCAREGERERERERERACILVFACACACTICIYIHTFSHVWWLYNCIYIHAHPRSQSMNWSLGHTPPVLKSPSTTIRLAFLSSLTYYMLRNPHNFLPWGVNVIPVCGKKCESSASGSRHALGLGYILVSYNLRNLLQLWISGARIANSDKTLCALLSKPS